MAGNRACAINYAKIRVVGTSNISLSRAIKLAKHFEIDLVSTKNTEYRPNPCNNFQFSPWRLEEKSSISYRSISFLIIPLPPNESDKKIVQSNHSRETIVVFTKRDYKSSVRGVMHFFFSNSIHYSTEYSIHGSRFCATTTVNSRAIYHRRYVSQREGIDQPFPSSLHPNPTQFFPQFHPRQKNKRHQRYRDEENREEENEDECLIAEEVEGRKRKERERKDHEVVYIIRPINKIVFSFSTSFFRHIYDGKTTRSALF